MTQLPERRRFRSSGGALSYVDVGEGAAVILLHGFPTWSYLWRDLVPVLASRFRVIAVDLLGHGESDHPRDARLDIAAQAGYVGELADHLGVDRYAVVGHAHGGGVAQLLLVAGAPVEAAVLLDPIAFDAWPVGATRELRELDPSTLTPRAVEEWIREAFAAGAVDPSAVGELDLRAYVAPWTDADGPQAFWRAARSLDGAGLMGHEGRFESVGAPILLLWGEDDPFLPPDLGERLNEVLPSSSLGQLPGCGHFLPEEAPETIYPMISEYLRVRYLHAPHGHAPADGLVMLQLERRPAWVDLAEYTEDDDEPIVPDPSSQEVGPGS
jgi:2-hydroxymuconate-semialdehyde hydrolase